MFRAFGEFPVLVFMENCIPLVQLDITIKVNFIQNLSAARVHFIRTDESISDYFTIECGMGNSEV